MSVDDPFTLLRRAYEELQLLDAIDAAAASVLRRELLAKPLDAITASDLVRIQGHVAAGRISQAQPRESHIERDYGAYLDAIPQGRKLLGDIEALARSRNFGELVSCSERVFVERLGFGSARVDESARLSRSEFARIEKLGSFHEFDVVCVELTRPNWFAAFYDVVFRLHPYALVLSIEPNARALRFVYRHGPSARPAYRSLTGPYTDWEPNDNLLVWTWRLHQLRPRIGESLHTLQRRVADALSRSPEEIGADWPSVRFPRDADPPGVPWRSAARRAFESFLQLGTPPTERRRWGLEAVLRDRFPIQLPAQQATVECVGYDVEPPHGEAGGDAAGNFRECHIRLHLAVREGERREPFTVGCALPEPDADGRFILDGTSYRFSAVVGAGGRLTAHVDEIAGLTDEDLADDQDDEDAAPEAAEPDDEPDEPDSRRPKSARGGFRGLSPRAFFEYTVSRKLASVAYALRHSHRPSDIPLREHVHLTLIRSGRRIDRLQLAAWSVLRSFLQPDRGLSTLKAEDWRVAGSPPSWCCLDRSAGLPVGTFAPIAGARMHPTGSLAVPVFDGPHARLVLSQDTALTCNGRLSGPVGDGTAAWWIADDLAPFASLPVGRLELSEQAVHAVPVTARVVVRHGPRRQAWVVRTLTFPRRGPRVVDARVPALRTKAPALAVQVGAYVGPGDPWLRLAPRTWPSMLPWIPAPIEKMAEEIAERAECPGESFIDDPRLVLRIPAGLSGLVTHASVQRIHGALDVDVAWSARLVLESAPTAAGTLYTVDGAAYPLAGVLEPCDMPFDDAGEAVDIVIESPHTSGDDGDDLFDPLEERTVRGAPLAAPLRFAPCPLELSTPPERFGRVRALDREEIPGHVLSPSFSEYERIRWLTLDRATAGFDFELDSALPVPTWVERFCDAARATGVTLDRQLQVSAPAPRQTGEFPDPTFPQLHKRQPASPEGAVCSLPIAALHPWHKAAAGALLGVTVDELELLISRHGLRPVLEALRAATEAPEEAALQRLAQLGDRDRLHALGDGLHELRQLSRPVLDAILLTELPVPSTRLLPAGAPPGSTRLVHTPLLTRYRGVELAIELCKDHEYAVDDVRIAAEIELQRAVDELFGAPTDAEPRGSDLAGWLTLAWPLTRPPSLRTAADDLTWAQTDDGRPVPAIRDDQGELALPPARHDLRCPAEPAWWAERAARAYLLEHRQAWFLGLFAGLDDPSGPRPSTRVNAEPGSCGAWAAREWVRRLELPESRPSRLLGLLTRTLPLRLASEEADARAALEPVLLAALPGHDEDGRLLRALVTEILIGFWTGPVDGDAPTGWLWRSADAGPVKGSRYLPPIDHRAWRLWPWAVRATSASQLLRALASGQTLPPLLRAVCGYPDEHQLAAPTTVELVPEPPDATEPSTTVRDSLDAMVLDPLEPVELLAPPTEGDISVTPLSLRQWLDLTRKKVNQ